MRSAGHAFCFDNIPPAPPHAGVHRSQLYSAPPPTLASHVPAVSPASRLAEKAQQEVEVLRASTTPASCGTTSTLCTRTSCAS